MHFMVSLAAIIGAKTDYLNTYEYDFLDRPTWARQQSQSGGNEVAYKRIEYRYNDIGQLTFVNRFETATTQPGTPSLRTVFEYDDDNQLVLLSHKAALHEVSATPLNEYDFVYDDAGRVFSIDSLIDGLTLYSFDTGGQLTDADHDSGNGGSTRPDEAYEFDITGNRISDSGDTITVGAQNRTLSDGVYTYVYDAEGNRTLRTRISDGSFEVNTFDHRNRLTGVDFYESGDVVGDDDPFQSINYTYDAFNRLVHRRVDVAGTSIGDTHQFFAGFDGDNSTLEFDGSQSGDLAHRRLWGPFVDQLIASEAVDSLTSAGVTFWPITDQVGTIRDVAVLDAVLGSFEIETHRVYNSFGLLTGEFKPDIDPGTGLPTGTGTPNSIDLDHGFTGKFHDALTGLTHHQNRWFDPQLGKWISEDPIGLAAGDVNTTRYVANSPLLYTDPTGLYATGSQSTHGGLNGDGGDGILACEEGRFAHLRDDEAKPWKPWWKPWGNHGDTAYC